LIGQSCEDGDPCTTGETYDNSCNCTGGILADANGDGICDALENDCVTVNYEDFESGLGIWTVNNSESFLANSPNSPIGNQSLHIRDNTGLTSSAHTQVIDLSAASHVELSFLYQLTGMDEAVDSFYLQVSIDGGSNFSLVESWVSGVDFTSSSGQVYNEMISLQTGQFSATTVFRFVNAGKMNADAVYLDNILIDACSSDCEPILIESNNADILQSASVDQYIQTNGRVSNGNIEYIAGDHILMSEGFEVEQGAVFHAYIAPCN